MRWSLEKVVNNLLNKLTRKLLSRGDAAKNYVYKNAGAIRKIISYHSEEPSSYQLIKLFYNQDHVEPSNLYF